MKQRTCRGCGALDHDLRKCPTAARPKVSAPIGPGMFAELDATEVEISELEQVRDVVLDRLVVHRRRTEQLRGDIAQARRMAP